MKKVIENNDDEILMIITEFVTPIILLMGIFIVLNGHLSPGGGFSGGTVLGSAFILYATAFGTESLRAFFTYKTFVKLTSFSLFGYGVIKGYSFLMYAAHLKTGIPKGLPGRILSGGAILPLNIFVGIIVGTIMYTLYALFSEGDF